MISHYLDLRYQIDRVNASFQQKAPASSCHIQKMFATAQTISLQVRVPGESLHLVLGKGNHFEGIGLASKSPVSQIRLRDRLLEYMRKNISSSQLIGIHLDDQDRIITLRYFKSGKENWFSLFYLARKTYMAHSYFEQGSCKQLCSWRKGKTLTPETVTLESHIELFDSIGRADLNKDLDREAKLFPVSQIWEKDLDFVEKGSQKEQNQLNKKNERKINFIKKDLEQTKRWKELQDWAINLVEDDCPADGKSKHFGLSFNWKYGKKLYEKKEMIFQRVKRLKRGEEILMRRLQETIDKTKRMTVDRDRTDNVEIEWSQSETKEKPIAQTEGAVTFHQLNDIKYGIGTTALGNDQLRSQYAKKTHWWFHVDAATSAHVIALTDDNTEDVLHQAAALLMKDMHKKQPEASEIDIIYTQVKNLKSVKGQAGKVLYKKEKRRRFYLADIKNYMQ